MKRPSRSFTVEVKRSRARAGEAPAAEVKGRYGQDPAMQGAAVSVSSSLSWGDLISRVSQEIAAKSPAAESPFTPPEAAPRSPAESRQPEPQGAQPPLTGEASFAGEAREGGGAPRSRVLPSLLPPEVPLAERKSSVYAQTVDSRSSARSRLPGPSPRQTGAPPTDLRPAPARDPAQALPQDTFRTGPLPSIASSAFDAAQIRAVVEEHLRQRQKTEDREHRPASAADIAVSGQFPAHAPGQAEIDAPPVGKRRREDFWKRRLRSYAARG